MSAHKKRSTIKAVTVHETVTLVLSARGRRSFSLWHESTGKKVYWGYDTGMTATTGGGVPLVADAIHSQADYTGDVYAITPAGTGDVTIGVAEVA